MKYGGRIDSALDKITDLILGKTNSSTHIKIIQRAFKPFGAKVCKSFSESVSSKSIIVSGQNSQWKMRQSIEIILNYNSESKRVSITDDIWKQLKFDLSQTLQHELIHRRQCSHMQIPSEDWVNHNCKVYASTIPMKKEAQEYLGSTDEIEAHAHCIMMEIKHNYPRSNPILLLKRAKKKITRTKSPILYDYFDAFGRDTNHPVLKRLFKKTVYWIENPEA